MQYNAPCTLLAGLALCTALTRESAATVRFEPYEALSSRGGWERKLGDTEAPLSLAVGASFVAVATDASELHIFRAGGSHQSTLSLAGRPVAVAASAALLVVVWHRSSPSQQGSQCLDFMVRSACPASDARDLKVNWPLGTHTCGCTSC